MRVALEHEYFSQSLRMCLILLVAAVSFGGGASRGDAAAIRSSFPNELLAVDSLWSIGGRATGPATRTPAGGPGRSRPAP